MWKVHAAHDPEHGCQHSLHFIEVAQLYPQVGDFITYRWLRVSIFPKVHFLRCTTKSSPQSLSQRLPTHKIFALRFYHYRSHMLHMPPLVPRLRDKLTPLSKSRKSHPVLMLRTFTKLEKQHATQLSLLISTMCFVLFTWFHVPRIGPYDPK
jgi:hypothetical protein